jgi:P22_AR N-terminal domain/ORF6C domain
MKEEYSMSEQALIPIEVREVEFYGDQIAGALVRVGDEAQVYVPVRPICDYLGLSWSGQRERIMRDEVLAEAVQFVRVTRTNTSERRGDPDVLCLPLELLPGFLFGVNTARVKDALKEKIIRYRRECYRYLWDAFKHDILPASELAPSTTGRSGAELAYEIATAVQHLARQQMEIEQRLGGRIDTMARWAKRTDERITTLELRLAEDEEQISEAQAAELALAVKTVANALAQQGATNSYGQVYGQLYRKFAITSYKSLPRRRLQEALEWLRGWYQEIEDQGSH